MKNIDATVEEIMDRQGITDPEERKRLAPVIRQTYQAAYTEGVTDTAEMFDEDEEDKYTLVGVDGNAFCVMGYVCSAMHEQKFTKQEVDAYLADAKSSDYNHLLCVSIEMVEKCNERARNRE